ncbi:hypothetical protein GIB67_001220, partial [Kingdonia uniflora]
MFSLNVYILTHTKYSFEFFFCVLYFFFQANQFTILNGRWINQYHTPYERRFQGKGGSLRGL